VPSKKLVLTIFFSLFFFSAVPINAATPQSFEDKFVGVNSIHLTGNFTPEKVDTSLSYLADSCGVSIIRLFLPYTDYPELTNLKYALQKGSEYGIKFIITLGDSWRLEPGLNFYPGDLEAYKQRARNTINELKDDYGSAIFAWELLNEPHCDYGPIKFDDDGNSYREFDSDCPDRLYNFVRDFSAEIKQLDPTHPVTIGLIGKHGDGRTVWSKFTPENSPYPNSSFVALNNIDTIDAAENHIYGASMETIQSDIDKAKSINKPFFVEEYGPDGVKKSRADQLKEKMQGSFAYGATGFLVWEYTPPGNDGDQFYFNQNHHSSLCNALKEEAARDYLPGINALPESYPLGPLDPSYYFTPPPNCNLEIMDFDNVHIQQILPGQPTEEAIHPRNTHPNYIANTNHDKFSLVCTTTAEIEQTFEPITSTSGTYQEYIVTQVAQRLKEDQYSSDLGKKLEMQFSETTNPFNPQIMQTAFTSYKNPISAFFRRWPQDQQEKYKLQRLENVALSLTNQDVISLDTQLAWRCSQKCFTLNCGKPEENCQSVRLSELAYYYKDQLSAKARKSLNSQYSHAQLLPPSCYQNMFRFLNPATPGSLGGQITIQQNGQTLTEKRGLPRTAMLADPIVQDIQNMAIPAHEQQTSSEICRFVKTPPTGDTTNIGPITFSAAINQEVIRDKARTFNQSISITNSLDSRLEKGIGTHQNFLKHFIPAEIIEQATQRSDQADSTVNQEQFVQFTDPGNPSLSNIFTNYFQPISWHSDQL